MKIEFSNDWLLLNTRTMQRGQRNESDGCSPYSIRYLQPTLENPLEIHTGWRGSQVTSQGGFFRKGLIFAAGPVTGTPAGPYMGVFREP